jgi:hypothetical protein
MRSPKPSMPVQDRDHPPMLAMALARSRRVRHARMGPPWRHDVNQTACDELGAVQSYSMTSSRSSCVGSIAGIFFVGPQPAISAWACQIRTSASDCSPARRASSSTSKMPASAHSISSTTSAMAGNSARIERITQAATALLSVPHRSPWTLSTGGCRRPLGLPRVPL